MSRQLAERIVDAVRSPLLVLDAAHRVVRANDAYFRDFEATQEETLGSSIFELVRGGFDHTALREALEANSPEGVGFHDLEVACDIPSRGRRLLLLNARGIATFPLILLSIEDVTERRIARFRLDALNAALEMEAGELTAASHALHEVTRIANEADSPEKAIAAALRAVCEHDDWEAGHAWWLANGSGKDLVPTGIWFVAGGKDVRLLQEASSLGRVGAHDGFVGAVIAHGGPLHVASLRDFAPWRRGDPERLGVRAALGFPVQVEDRTVAVLEFFHGEKLERRPEFLDVMMDIGVQVGHAIERHRLERTIAARTDEERQHLAQDLHDSLGQQIAGATIQAANIERALSRRGAEEAATARKLVRTLEEAKRQVRALAKGLLPVEIEPDGLNRALADLVETAGEGFPSIAMRFECDAPVEVPDKIAATQLYRIAQEALYNAATHASPRSVTVRLSASADLELEVRDDGTGLPDPLPPGAGSGLRIMRHRAALIGGSLGVEAAPGGGTTVRCRVASWGGPRPTDAAPETVGQRGRSGETRPVER